MRKDGDCHQLVRAGWGVISLRRDVGVFLFFLVVAVFGALKLAMSQALSAEEQPTTFRGTVVNSVTHAPIRRALVYSADNRFATLTDGEGHFEFAYPNPKTPPKGQFSKAVPARCGLLTALAVRFG